MVIGYIAPPANPSMRKSIVFPSVMFTIVLIVIVCTSASVVSPSPARIVLFFTTWRKLLLPYSADTDTFIANVPDAKNKIIPVAVSMTMLEVLMFTGVVPPLGLLKSSIFAEGDIDVKFAVTLAFIDWNALFASLPTVVIEQ